MMRAWGNRADPVVIDEPLYAYYLKMTGIEHPGAGARMPVATAGLGLFTQSNDKLI